MRNHHKSSFCIKSHVTKWILIAGFLSLFSMTMPFDDEEVILYFGVTLGFMFYWSLHIFQEWAEKYL